LVDIVQETDEWRVVRNGAGAVLKWWKNKSGTPEHIDFTMTSRAVWERDYRPHLLEVDRKRIDVDATRAISWAGCAKTSSGISESSTPSFSIRLATSESATWASAIARCTSRRPVPVPRKAGRTASE